MNNFLKFFIFNFIFHIIPFCFEFSSNGLTIKSFSENSILSEIFSERRFSKFYLLEYNGNLIPDPLNKSGDLNFKITLKNLYELCNNPPKNEFTKFKILEDNNGFLSLHIVEIRPWDGIISFEEKTKSFTNLENIEKIYHNSFKYFQNAKKFYNEKEFDKTIRYLNLIKKIDPNGSEAKESDILMIKIKFDETLEKAHIYEKQKNFEDAIKNYEKSKKIYLENLEVFKEMENIEKELNLKIEEIKKQMAEIERQKKEVEKMNAEKERQEKERLEKLKIEKEEREKQLQTKREKEEREKQFQAQREKEERENMLLNKFRIFRQNKEYEKAKEIMDELNEIAGSNEKVREEVSKFKKEIFEDYLSKSKEYLKKKEYLTSLKYLYSANSWVSGKEEVSKLKTEIKENIKFGEVTEEYLAVFLWEPDSDISFILAPPANEKKYIGKIFFWYGILKSKLANLYEVEFGRTNAFCFEASFDIDVSFNSYVKVIGMYKGNEEFIYNNGAPAPCLFAIWVGH